MSTNTVYAILEQQAQGILQQLYELRCRLAQIRAQQNTLIPVNNIPDELLHEIFTRLVQPTDYDGPPPFDLVHVSHVCRRWRNLSIGNPRLWVEIQVYHPEQASAFLERSGEMLLRMSLARNMSVELDTLFTLVIPHIPRLRALSLSHGWSTEEMVRWMAALSGSASRLEELSLRLGDVPQEDVVDHIINGDPIFGDSLPALRSLSLYNIFQGPFAWPLYGGLRRLSLSSQIPQLTLPALFRVLQHCSELETLALMRCTYGRDGQSGVQPGETVALAHLSSFTLETDSVDHLHYLLQHILFPPTVLLHIGVLVLPDTSDNEIILPLSAKTLPALSGMRALYVAFKDGACTEQGWNRDYGYTVRASPNPTQAPRLSLDVANPYEPLGTQIDDIPRFLDVGAVETYVMDLGGFPHDQHLALRTWEAVLAPMHALRVLRVRHGELAELFTVLGRQGAEAVCPMLEMLEIEAIACSEGFWEDLRDALAHRGVSEGGPLARVKVTVVGWKSGDEEDHAFGEVRALLGELVVEAPRTDSGWSQCEYVGV